MADEENNTSKPVGDIIYVWKIPIDRTYVKSLNSIFKLAAAALSLIAFICVASGRSDNCDDSYSSTYNYYEFVSITAFLTLMLFWFLYTLTLTSRLFLKLVPWTIVDFIYCAVFIVFYLIANIVLAAQSCGKDSNKAGAAFGFFAMFCLCANAFFLFREWRSSRYAASANSGTGNTNQAGEYNAERNMEQY